MAINDNVYVNGFGATSGDALLLDGPWYTNGAAIYVDSTNGNDSNPGTSRPQAKLTLAGGVGAASAGDYVVLVSGYAETIVSTQTVGAGITIVGEGTSGGQPTATITRNAIGVTALEVLGDHVEIRNIKFAQSLAETNGAAVHVGELGTSVLDCLVKGCLFEVGGDDVGGAMKIINADRVFIEDTTLVATATSVALSNVGITVTDMDVANLRLSNVVFDGGVFGWFSGGAMVAAASTLTFADFQGITLLGSSNLSFTGSNSTGRINAAATGSGTVTFS